MEQGLERRTGDGEGEVRGIQCHSVDTGCELSPYEVWTGNGTETRCMLSVEGGEK